MPPGMALLLGGGLGGHDADDFAFPQEVLRGQPAEAALDTGRHAGAGHRVEEAEPEPVCAEPLASSQNDDRSH